MLIIVVYHTIVLALAAGMLALAVFNFATFRRPRAPIVDPDVLPFISVLVPARDEERHIEECVASLLALNYPHYEVVVLDDGSADRTYEILVTLRERDDRLRIVIGAELPEGWCGKPHACWQLAQAALGEYVLFTDADCRLRPDALLLALGAHTEHEADLVSMMPDYVAETFWERLILPLLVMIPMSFLPIAAVRGSRWPLWAAANGAFVFMRREEYMRCGGHAAVRDQLAEDVKLAQHVKRFGMTEWYGDGIKVYGVRMYDGLGEIIAGFRKNLYAAFSRKPSILIPGLLLVTAVMILPAFWTAVGFATGARWMILPASTYVLTVLIRLGTVWRLGRDEPVYALLNPLSWLAAVGIALLSMRDHYSGGARWKGRVYGRRRK